MNANERQLIELIHKGEGMDLEFKTCRNQLNRDVYETENSNRPHGFGVLNPETFTPFPKNPVIAAFFRQIGRADELGSGMRKMMRYGKAYGGADPQMIESDVFRIIVKVPEFSTTDEKLETSEVTLQVTPHVTPQVTPQVERLLRVVKDEVDRDALQKAVGLKARKNFRQLYLAPAIDAGLIEMTVPDKPRSSKQKYRLTEKGRKALKEIKGGSK